MDRFMDTSWLYDASYNYTSSKTDSSSSYNDSFTSQLYHDVMAPMSHDDDVAGGGDDVSWNTAAAAGGSNGGTNNAKIIFQQPSEALQVFGKAVEILNVFGVPCIIIIGTIGNCLSLLVFLATRLRRHSSSVYLVFLNIADTLFLLCLIVKWLGFLDVHLIHIQGWCQTVIYLSYVSSFSSVYIVVGFTVERWVVVYYPLKRTAWCSRRRALLLVTSVVALAVIVYSYTTWTSAVINVGNEAFPMKVCMPRIRFYGFVQVMNAVDTLITLLVPSLVIVALNVCIMLKIWRFLHARCSAHAHQLGRGGGGGGAFTRITSTQLGRARIYHADELDTLHNQTSATLEALNMTSSTRVSSPRHRLQLRTTRSLIIVSTTFVLLNLPSHAFRVVAAVKEMVDPEFRFSHHALLWQHICQIIYYSNFAVNYFLYCLCSKSFRVASRKLRSRFVDAVVLKIRYII